MYVSAVGRPRRRGVSGLGLIMPKLDVQLSYGGRTITVEGGLDTGADTTVAIMDQAIISQLGLPRTGTVRVYTAAGPRDVYTSRLDFVSVVGSPGCLLRDITDVWLSPVEGGTKVLLGENFVKAMGGSIVPTPDGLKLTCKPGEALVIERVPTWAIVAGVGVAAAAGLAIFLGLR